jgi:hypothetical protein
MPLRRRNPNAAELTFDAAVTRSSTPVIESCG